MQAEIYPDLSGRGEITLFWIAEVNMYIIAKKYLDNFWEYLFLKKFVVIFVANSWQFL